MNENIAERVLREHDNFDGAEPIVPIDGMSSPRVCNFLNRLVAHLEPGETYLEIGTWKGLTLLSAAYGNVDKVCIGCDKFRFWGRWTGFGWRARRAFRSNLERFRGRCAHIDFHETTSKRLFDRHLVQAPVGVYFYDGDHSYAGTRHGIMAAVPILSRRAVILIDDWNASAVHRGAHAGLRDGGLTVLWQRELPGAHTKETWWNGLGVFYVERPYQ
jgi:methyltransferase family protein